MLPAKGDHRAVAQRVAEDVHHVHGRRAQPLVVLEGLAHLHVGTVAVVVVPELLGHRRAIDGQDLNVRHDSHAARLV